MNNLGHEPIATTYDDLQALKYISRFHESINQAESDCVRARLVSAASLELVFIACNDLSQRLTRLAKKLTESSNLNKMAHLAMWQREFLNLGLKLADLHLSQFANAGADAIPFSVCDTPGAIEFKSSQNQLEAVLTKKCQNSKFRSALRKNIEDHGSYTSISSFVHSFKCSSHLHRCISVRLQSSNKNARSLGELSYWSNLKLAVEAITLKRETFLTQFRVLHQIPELLALEIAYSCSPILNFSDHSKLGAKNVFQALRSVTRHSGLMVDCLQPISLCMFPADYRQIRRNLGKTSGSQSKAIAHNLLSKLMLSLPMALENIFERKGFRRSPYKSLVSSEVSMIFQNLDLWRDMHLSFPRNVLGVGTVSLIGASDATKAVHGMKCTVHKRRAQDLTKRPSLFNSAQKIAIQTNDANRNGNQDLGDFEAVLLNITGEVMQRRFPDVQNRRGYFSETEEGK